MNTITLNKKNLKRFIIVFKNVLYLNILDIDILVIDSIKKKLKFAYIEMKSTNSKAQTITFTTDELRTFKHLSKEFVNIHKNKEENLSNQSNFDKYLKNFQGLDNNDK